MPLTPNNREEHWLQGMVDGSTDLTPNNRREHWYKEIIDNGSGGGGGGGVLVCNINTETGLLDKTWKEILDAMGEGKIVVEKVFMENFVGVLLFNQAYYDDGETHPYIITAINTNSTSVDNQTDYPQAIMF